MRKALLVSLSMLGLIALPGQAHAAGGDQASTAAYLRADYALVSSAHAKLGASKAALQSLLSRVRRECPGVVAGSPQDEASEKLTDELVGAMHLVALKPIAAAVAAFARDAAGLRWSNRALTRELDSYARELLTQSRIAVPDFCGELRDWRSDGYTSLPAGTLPFDRAYFAVYVGVGLLPLKALAPYISSSQRGLVRQTRLFESDVIELEAHAVETWGEIMDCAGLNP